MSQKDQPEVIDPDDQRYKDPDHFNKHSQKPYAGTHQHQSYNYTKNVGCGCGPFGCLSGCITLILLSSLLTFLLNFLF
ncbi:hypothetical protein AST00_04945 [Staphylococcus equorum]|uniref:hypothetical protein n=1 Tax=Staphylococcus equorum TaxID=246432 RepID=UPI000853EAB7|nr:hypothetical protein [Staphylococcus equorum]OEK66751.1 hypothetical protein AST02_11620 [Staphylococcus equorum]OEK68479.1 hypothetical protein AST00_04945 [Staphylococcus equorum]